jgi:tellurite resistance protein TehA-like permease
VTAPSIPATAPPRPAVTTLLPIVAVVFVAFTVIGLALPVLPLHVHADLGFGTLTVGLVAGAQFGAALISRFWSGTYWP